MEKQRAHYVLENEAEANRLEEQAQMPGYRLEEELRDIRIAPQSKILDAGCGSGLLSRYLVDRFQEVRIDSCDASAIRVKQAQALSSDRRFENIKYFESKLENLPASSGRYDAVFCRYVFEHLTGTHQNVANEFYRVLRTGGKACLIDFDGIIVGLQHYNPELKTLIEKVVAGMGLDLYVGRKLAGFLYRAGFKNIEWRMDGISFQGDNLRQEAKLTFERLTFAIPLFAKILGSEEKAMQLRKLYCSEMMHPASVLYYNKFIVTGTKE